MTIPLPRTNTSVFAVPRSIARSSENCSAQRLNNITPLDSFQLYHVPRRGSSPAEPPALVSGRDVFGTGTEETRSAFRRELLYHDASYHWQQETPFPGSGGRRLAPHQSRPACDVARALERGGVAAGQGRVQEGSRAEESDPATSGDIPWVLSERPTVTGSPGANTLEPPPGMSGLERVFV